ncbi:hypothetical protein BV898_14879 [Hypsibius exemplaris]|uniref:Uncharacterized protein n=1 Tax=Hypsibius exemplaris TaxID=2072580 RepID=A0A9X6RJY2_HYPEX|nr:hypothetical protein BV898_14879 [Hypsibius exemplaris]
MHSWTDVYPEGRWSQSSMDLYLDQIFSIIGSTNKYFVEFGFDGLVYRNSNNWNEGSGSNTGNLYAKGWRGLLLDSKNENPAINLKKHSLYANNIAQILSDYGVPKDLDFLSCDLDSHDLWVMRAILEAGYRPRVMTVEYNVNYPISVALTSMDPTVENHGSLPRGYKFRWQHCAFGASAKALWIVANSFDYVMIGRVSQLDLIFIRKELLEDWMLVPEMEWFFRDMNYTLLHNHLGNRALLRHIVDYEMYLQTSDLIFSHASARRYLKHLDLECFRAFNEEF